MELCKGLAHVAVAVVNIEDSIKWYEKIGGCCHNRGELKTDLGVKKLALVNLFGVEFELIENEEPALLPSGAITHVAIEVEELPKVIEYLKSKGVDSFMTEEIVNMPELFGGLRNIFIKGPSGEEIEFIEMGSF